MESGLTLGPVLAASQTDRRMARGVLCIVHDRQGFLPRSGVARMHYLASGPLANVTEPWPLPSDRTMIHATPERASHPRSAGRVGPRARLAPVHPHAAVRCRAADHH